MNPAYVSHFHSFRFRRRVMVLKQLVQRQHKENGAEYTTLYNTTAPRSISKVCEYLLWSPLMPNTLAVPAAAS